MAAPSLGEPYAEIIPGLVESSGSRRTVHYATLSAAANEESATRLGLDQGRPGDLAGQDFHNVIREE
jgi:hypothetical protein